jgi:hypothetical protein
MTMTSQNSFGAIPKAVNDLGVYCVVTGSTVAFAGAQTLSTIIDFMNHSGGHSQGLGLAILGGASALLAATVWKASSLVSENIETQCERTKGWQSVLPYRAKKALSDIVEIDVDAGLLTVGFAEAAITFNNNLFWLGSAVAALGGAALHLSKRRALGKSLLPTSCP